MKEVSNGQRETSEPAEVIALLNDGWCLYNVRKEGSVCLYQLKAPGNEIAQSEITKERE